MTRLSDQDLELLDAHLDDALSAIDAEHLRLRLAAEPDLAAALEELRAQRVARLAVWQSMESDAADSVVDRALHAGRFVERRRWLTRAVGAVAAAAACFAAGWFGRGGAEPSATSQAVVAVAHPASRPSTTPIAPGTYQVALTDAAGNVLAVQSFTKLDEAQRFAADLTAWQAQQLQQPPKQGQMVLISDEF